MPFKNWPEAKARLDAMINCATPVAEGAAIKQFSRRYGDRHLTITIMDSLPPIFTYGGTGRRLDLWETINLIKTWDSPDRVPAPAKNDWEFTPAPLKIDAPLIARDYD